MTDDGRITIPARGVRSLCWHGDDLVDWVGGNALYRLDGSSQGRSVLWSYRFDAATASPSGRYAAIYERTGTKALVLDGGKPLRELNRSFYHANDYEYPIVLFALPDGREVVAHCPEDYCRIEIEELATGDRLTARGGAKRDFFHSRLAVDPSGRFLLDAGWVWHPFDSLLIFDIARALADPTSLDGRAGGAFEGDGVEVNTATFLDSDLVVVAAAGDAEDALNDEPGPRRSPGTIAVYDLTRKGFLSIAPIEETVGTMMPVGTDHVIGFFESPKLIELDGGRIVRRWPDLKTGRQNSSIIRGAVPIPPLALDPIGRRFAVADERSITVVTV